jgi:hypothetical protein
MAIFEIEGPDGAIYEVDAPDEQSAIAGFQQAMGGQRVDPETNQPAGVPEYSPPGVDGYDPQTGEVSRAPRSRLASAAHGAADVATFGFGDELASYLGSAITGDPREQVLAEMRGMQQQAQADNPWSYMGGQLAGGVAQGAGLVAGGLSPAAHAINAGWRLPGVMAASGVEGGVLGALHGAGAGETADERLSGASQGLALGGILGAAAPAVVQGVSSAARRVVSPFRTSPERVAAAQTLRAEGVPVTAGQLTGNRSLRFSESELGGRAAANLMDDQKDAFTKAILGRAGVTANRATPEVVDDAFRVVGQQFDDLAARNTLTADARMIQDVRAVFNNYGLNTNETARRPIVEKLTRDIVDASRKGQVSGGAYQKLSKELAKAARSAGKDFEAKEALYGLRDALDGAMERSMVAAQSPDVGAWQAVRTQYRNLLPIEAAATRAGEDAAEGLISPANIRNAAIQLQGRRAYARGQGDFADLARAGSMLLSPLPDSGTAGRLRAQNLAAFGPMIGGAVIGGGAGAYQSGDMTGALAGAAAGALAPRVAGRALMSRPVQSYLSNQIATGAPDPLKRAIMNAILTGNTSALAGRLSAP